MTKNNQKTIKNHQKQSKNEARNKKINTMEAWAPPKKSKRTKKQLKMVLNNPRNIVFKNLLLFSGPWLF